MFSITIVLAMTSLAWGQELQSQQQQQFDNYGQLNMQETMPMSNSGPSLAAQSTDHHPFQYEEKQPVVYIDSNEPPFAVRFNTHTSHINAVQKHTAQPGSVQHSSQTDPAQVLIQQIHKPIIQQVHELISPYRYVTQEVRPVQETIQTIVAKEQKVHYPSHSHDHGSSSYQHAAASSYSPTLTQTQTQTQNQQTSPHLEDWITADFRQQTQQTQSNSYGNQGQTGQYN